MHMYRCIYTRYDIHMLSLILLKQGHYLFVIFMIHGGDNYVIEFAYMYQLRAYNKNRYCYITAEFHCKSRHTGPVSYTHLDVYKRQLYFYAFL